MINAVRAELRKLYTVRSTYVIAILAFGLAVGLMAFYAMGFRDGSHAATSTDALMNMLLNTTTIVALFVSCSAILMVGHEYRYNTILYSLTNTKSRLNTFFGKWLVVIAHITAVTAIVMVCSWAAFYMGQHSAHIHTLPQTVAVWDVIWKGAVTVIGMASYAYLITVLARSLVASFAIFFVMPSMVENLLGLILKDNVLYLPFAALANVMGATPTSAVSAVASSQVVLLYVVVAGALAAFLFTERDAN